MRRPSDFRRASVFVPKQNLNARRNKIDDEDGTSSASSVQNEGLRGKKSKSSFKGSGKRSSTLDSKSSRSASSREMRRHQPMIEQSKKDILDYLDNLIESVEWLVLFSYIEN